MNASSKKRNKKLQKNLKKNYQKIITKYKKFLFVVINLCYKLIAYNL